KRLIQPGDAQTTALILHQRLKDFEARAAGRPQAAVHDSPDDRGVLARLQRSNRLETTAILVTDGKAIQEIFDGREPDMCEVSGAARSDAFQELQRRRERFCGHPNTAEDQNCTELPAILQARYDSWCSLDGRRIGFRSDRVLLDLDRLVECDAHH